MPTNAKLRASFRVRAVSAARKNANGFMGGFLPNTDVLNRKAETGYS
jgi:hypothetical protein